MIKTKLAPFLKFLFIFTLSVSFVCFGTRAEAAHGRTSLSQQEKTKKKQDLDTYFTSKIATARAEQAKEDSPLHIQLNTAMGIDNNTELDSTRKSDYFHEESANGIYIQPHEGLPGITGPGHWSLRGFTLFKDYFDVRELDYHFARGGFAIDTKVGPHFVFDASYHANWSRYIHDNPLTYFSHEMEYGMSFRSHGNQSHRGFTRFEYSDYTDRKALSTTLGFQEEDRKDDLFEIGYSWTMFPSDTLVLGNTVSWILNDSNDQLLDFNDYEAARINSFIWTQITEDLSWIVYGGYEYREYDDLIFVFGSTEPERDNSFYVGSNVSYTISSNTQLVLTYLYIQNDSNDRLQEYSGSTINLGLQIDL